jgi:cysteine-rich repeat protein
MLLLACSKDDSSGDEGGTDSAGGTGTGGGGATSGDGADDGGDDGSTGGGGDDGGSTDSGGDGGSDTGNTEIPADCGNGVVDGDEVCDDGNNVTELPPYEDDTCIDDCSMLLATCGDGNLDPGEACDDGNDDSMDECTTSCTVNDKWIHSPCTRSTGPDDMDVTSGEITGCENIEVPEGMELACTLSNNFYTVTLVYAAEGDCQTMALKCEGAACPPSAGDYDADITCPDGAVLVQKNFEGPFGVQIDSKVCQKGCETDADCRWNAYDEFWDAPGQYRCEVTAFSGGEKVCNDGQNNE